MAAYVIDVYRGRMGPEECPVSYAAEILMFPKLLSGPLMDPAELKAQMYRRTCTLRELDAGLRDFIIGLSMKVLLANQIGGLTQTTRAGDDGCKCAMEVTELDTGRRLSLSQALGAGSNSCSLDPAALAEASGALRRAVATRASVIAFLASDEASFVTGALWMADGGYTIV